VPKQGRFRSKSYKSVQEVAAGRRKKNREKQSKTLFTSIKIVDFVWLFVKNPLPLQKKEEQPLPQRS